MDTYRATPVSAERYHHAEGPAWDARSDRLLWIDQHVGHFHVGAWDATAGRVVPERSVELGSPVGAVVPDHGGDGWVAAAALGFVRVGGDGRLTEIGRASCRERV